MLHHHRNAEIPRAVAPSAIAISIRPMACLSASDFAPVEAEADTCAATAPPPEVLLGDPVVVLEPDEGEDEDA